MFADLRVDGVDDAARAVLGEQEWVDFVRGQAGVDIVLGECFRRCGGHTGPDHVVGVDWWDEEREVLSFDVVDKIGVRQVTSGKVVEIAALPGRYVRIQDIFFKTTISSVRNKMREVTFKEEQAKEMSENEMVDGHIKPKPNLFSTRGSIQD